ncbi:hypothetical protein A3860_36350 [Niastella vici]|uniref:Uncharacterized protein n=1 Tax=Niastella vici TaxID=1703345 RepID=A0A1V9FN27_9BACT|nr:hypothetical protein [Niastella vici]OQP59753.1 hypothetical protein A3860_36350 [Niastella vici]
MKIRGNCIARGALTIIILCTSIIGFSQNYAVKTGNYEETIDLSFDNKSGIISGIIARSNDDNGPRISCSLIFKSVEHPPKIAGFDRYAIDFRNEGDSAIAGHGYIEIKNDGVIVKCFGIFSNCQNFLDLAGETGESFTLTTPKPFISANIISSTKAYVYKTTTDTAKTKMYLIKNNFISILTVNDS